MIIDPVLHVFLKNNMYINIIFIIPNNSFEINTVNIGAELLIVSVKLTAT
jgi:hypothetical protein